MAKPVITKFNLLMPLIVQEYERRLPTAFDESLSLLEKVNKIIQHLHEIDELVNEVVTQWNEVMEWVMNDGLTEAVNAKLDQMIEDGTFADIINNKIFGELNADMQGRGMNIMRLGAKGNGVDDDSDLLIASLATFNHIVIPKDCTLAISKTIFVKTGQSLRGMIPNVRGYKGSPTMKWIGASDNRKAMIVLGTNDVGAEPTIDASNVWVESLLLDGDYKVGVGVYGTYLTNETNLKNVVAQKTLEFGMYLARSWYGKFTNLTALKNKGKGLAFGMPLIWQNGVKVTWATPSPLEMNNAYIEDVRSHEAGQFYAVDNPSIFNPTNVVQRIQGYGIGIGYGNGMQVTNFLSEKSGGVNLYVLTGSQPVKKIEKGYLESANYFAGLADAERCNIIIEHDSPTGGTYTIQDIFMNFYSGGIYHTGVLGRKVRLRNLHQPIFLKSLDGLTAFQLYAEVLKDNVYSGCGLYNTLETYAGATEIIQSANTRYTFNIPSKTGKWFKLIYVRGTGTPYGGFQLQYEGGTTADRSFPVLTTDWQLATVANANLINITKTGGTGAVDQTVEFKIVPTPPTYE